MPAKAKNFKLKSKPNRLPRQRQLPGVENNRVASIENVALSYAQVLDARMELTKQESDLKQKLLTLMHKLHKTEYRRNGISVTVTVEHEKVHVKVRGEKEESMVLAEQEQQPQESPDQPEQEEQEEEQQESPEQEEEEEEEEEESQASDGGPF